MTAYLFILGIIGIVVFILSQILNDNWDIIL